MQQGEFLRTTPLFHIISFNLCLYHVHRSTLHSGYQPCTLPQLSVGRLQPRQSAADDHTPHSDASLSKLLHHPYPHLLPPPSLCSQ